MLRTCEGKPDFSKINVRFATARDLNICLNQIKLPLLLYRCDSISELPSVVNNMYKILFQNVESFGYPHNKSFFSGPTTKLSGHIFFELQKTFF